jgi:RHS repeat-associated protein
VVEPLDATAVGDYSDEVAQITSTAVDDVWSAGYVGLYRTGGSALQQFDDVKVGYDNDADGDIADAGDDMPPLTRRVLRSKTARRGEPGLRPSRRVRGQVLDDFSSSIMSLTYDDNGNLTDDGVLRYVYDGWNRLVKAQRYADGDTTTIGEYRYLPDNRRASKVVSHAGVEAVAGDGGNATVHYYYSSRWQILEARNGSNQATRQWVWGTQYVDEPLLMDVNGEAGTNNTCDPDVTDATSIKDRRYYCQQDRNWNVVALFEADDTQGTAGRCVERYAYTPYGEFLVLKGEGGSGNLGNGLVTSTVGNPFTHQGLSFDQEKGSYQNRHREYATGVQRFAQRDPDAAGPAQVKTDTPWMLGQAVCERGRGCRYKTIWTGRIFTVRAGRGYQDGIGLYQYARSSPTARTDPTGLSTKCGTRWCLCSGTGGNPVNVYGNSARAKALLELKFGRCAQGCVTLLNWFTTGAEIYCTGSCEDIKDWEGAPGVPILDHECCHACDYFDGGVCKYLDGAIHDNCNSRPVGGFETW